LHPTFDGERYFVTMSLTMRGRDTYLIMLRIGAEAEVRATEGFGWILDSFHVQPAS